MKQSTALEILKTGTNVFLTGEPGSGKTYLVNEYVRWCRNHDVAVAMTASTGIAATHISGMTIHSWSGIGIKKSLTKHDLEFIADTDRLVKQINAAKVLVIDEISMLEAGTLDMVEQVCRTVRKTPLPFGGLQVVLVGDFYQLPPISKGDEPPAQFAFLANAWTEAMFEVCYLTEQHRQSDAALSSVLAAIRGGMIEDATHAHLETRRIDDLQAHADTTKLYSHNANVDDVNAERLQALPGEVHVFTMDMHGKKSMVENLVRGCMSPERLEVKIGAAVMCTRNNPDKGFVNGTLGTVVDFSEDQGFPIIKTRNGRRITIEPQDWEIDDGERVKARITQVPLRLAWAITVHKSQGMSLDAAVMDLSKSFAFGQGYVALSRVRRLDGLFLLGWNDRALRVDPVIQEQDRAMRAQSERTEQAWAARSALDQKKQQDDFLRASGGSVESKYAPIKRGVVVNVPPHAKRLAEMRKQYPQAYTPWTKEMDNHLTKLFADKKRIGEIAKELERHPGGIRSRLKKLGLMT